MSMPKFPTEMHTPKLEEAINQTLSSIAMEQLALSHIMNAEGEKLQFVLGTLEDSKHEKHEKHVTVDELLEINESVRKMLDTIVSTEVVLKVKMTDALEALKEHEKDDKNEH